MDKSKVDRGRIRARRGIYLALSLVAVTLASGAVLIILLSRTRVSDAVIAGVAAAGITGAVSVLLAVVNFFDRQREANERLETQRQAEKERVLTRQEENVLRALDYFTGKTQRRNVGIAIVEGYWHAVPSLRGVLIPLLVNQGKYLLLQSGQEEAPHEVDNCRRIMQLLVTSGDTKPEFTQYYKELLDAVQQRLTQSVVPTGNRRGISVSSETMETWATQLQAKLPNISDNSPCRGTGDA